MEQAETTGRIGYDELDDRLKSENCAVMSESASSTDSDHAEPVRIFGVTDRDETGLLLDPNVHAFARLAKTLYVSGDWGRWSKIEGATLDTLPEGLEVEQLEARRSQINALFARAEAHIEAIKTTALREIEREAQQHGLALLEAARHEIFGEAAKYFGGSVSEWESLLFDAGDPDPDLDPEPEGLTDEGPLAAIPFDFNNPNTVQLVESTLLCHTLHHQYLDAASAHLAARNQSIRTYFPDLSATLVIPSELWERVGKYVDQDPEIKDLSSKVEASLNTLMENLIGFGQTHPLIWRLYKAEPQSGPAEVWGRVIKTALWRAYSANVALTASLERDAELVWDFPPLIERTMLNPKGLALPDGSIALAAGREKAGIPRLTYLDYIQLGVGVTQLSLLALGLAGVVLASNPIGWAVAVVDAVIAAPHMIQEYRSTRLKEAGYEAVLNPTEALGADPDWFGTIVSIALDALAFLPSPQPALRSVVP